VRGVLSRGLTPELRVNPACLLWQFRVPSFWPEI
jgi:hypothetical protein